MRVWTGLGVFQVKRVLTSLPARDSIKVFHDGPLKLEVTDPKVRDRVLSLALWDIFAEKENHIGRIVESDYQPR